MPYPETTTTFCVKSHETWTEFHKEELKLKPFEEYDVDIAVDACGVCGSDVHSITGGWGETPMPLCVGHEIIGRVLRVGDKVSKFKKGDRVGVGAQIQSCMECVNCKSDQENYCPKMVDTYGAPYPDGTISQGGYSSHVRAHEKFTFAIPANISDKEAGPMMCAGITVYSPLVRLGAGPGKHVAIVGIGGLGHFALLWAKALGAEVTAISHSPDKKADALRLGADHFISSNQKDWHKDLAFTFDFIINSADMTHMMDVDAYMSTMKVMGRFHNVGLPDEPLPQMKAQQFMPGGYYIGASHIGNAPEMEAMLKLASEKNIHPDIETLDISAENCSSAVQRVKKNDVRYRFTLVNYDAAFGKRA